MLCRTHAITRTSDGGDDGGATAAEAEAIGARGATSTWSTTAVGTMRLCSLRRTVVGVRATAGATATAAGAADAAEAEAIGVMVATGAGSTTAIGTTCTVVGVCATAAVWCGTTAARDRMRERALRMRCRRWARVGRGAMWRIVAADHTHCQDTHTYTVVHVMISATVLSCGA